MTLHNKEKINEEERTEDEMLEILAEHGNRWFGFGVGVGIVITCLVFGIINKYL